MNTLLHRAGSAEQFADNTPDWWRNAVIYQIYPRSFADGNGDGIGDLRGVRERLPYLSDLGVDAIWFTPWYASPWADGGYDVEDYRRIHPSFGSLADAEHLIAEAAHLGIHVIVDIVPNHVSDQHPWFREALAAEPGSPARDRFWFHDGVGDEPPTHWRSNFGGGTWTRTVNSDGSPGQWYLHLFSPEQPDLNWNHPDVRSEHERVLRFWFDLGVAGVRIDSAALLVKDPTLPEIPESSAPGQHPTTDRDELHDIYRSWRSIADEYETPRILVGEIWLPDAERFARYLRHDEMHTAFNFDFLTRSWSASELRHSIESTLAAHHPVDAPATWVLSNHDITRPVTRFGRTDSSFSFETKRAGVPSDLTRGTARARAACLLTAALPGSLYIYQGDELGLPEVEDIPEASISDPMHFRSGGVDPGRDGCRVPLPWSGNQPPYGFTKGRSTWLPQPTSWEALTVEHQNTDSTSMLVLYRDALRLRRSRAEFASRCFDFLQTPPDVLGFARGGIHCFINFSDQPFGISPDATVLLASEPLENGLLLPDAAVWIEFDSAQAP